ncbi:hypothetical protein NEOKW01_0602 [Nematocida sp. AWRm80]|nr:hypothetical protein NEOKW01_0602 [Nematocida sp. AWRm80]
MVFVYAKEASQRVTQLIECLERCPIIKIVPRTGIACCLLNGRTFNNLPEVGILLLYLSSLLFLNTQNIFAGVFQSVITLCICSLGMLMALRLKRKKIVEIFCCLFCCWDLFMIRDISSFSSPRETVLFGGISLSILLMLYGLGKARVGIYPCIFKDTAVIIFGMLGYLKVNSVLELFPYVVNTTLILWGAISLFKQTPVNESDLPIIETAKVFMQTQGKAIKAITKKRPGRPATKKTTATKEKPKAATKTTKQAAKTSSKTTATKTTTSSTKTKPIRAAAQKARQSVQ